MDNLQERKVVESDFKRGRMALAAEIESIIKRRDENGIASESCLDLVLGFVQVELGMVRPFEDIRRQLGKVI